MSTTAEKDLLRKLKIKTGTATRISKELKSYEKEAEKQQERINQMKARNDDSHSIKKQEEVLGETTTMIPDTKKRLEAAVADLKEHMALISANLQNSEEWKQASEVSDSLDV